VCCPTGERKRGNGHTYKSGNLWKNCLTDCRKLVYFSHTWHPFPIATAQPSFIAVENCLGLKKGITLHSYRYAFAERAYASGYNEHFAQAALGHKTIR